MLPSTSNAELNGETTPRPNILVIIADDLGYGETGMMGSLDIPTPHIDALADSGIRCTSGYVTSSYCSPSRAGITTGRYQARFGYDHNPVGKKNLLETAGLPENQTTFVTRLKQAGYRTGLIGKWHLGATETKHPTRRGFDRFFGFLHEGHYYVPGPPFDNVWTMIRDTSLPDGKRVREGNLFRGNYAPINEPSYDQDNPVTDELRPLEQFEYLTDTITDQSVEFLTKAQQNPFCLVVSYNAVHSPMQAKISDLQQVAGIEDEQRRIFAGMLIAMDRGVGKLRAAVEQQGLDRNTLVVFVSDNGGPTKELTSSNAPLRGGKGSLYEGGVRVPMIWSMPGRLDQGITEKQPVLSLDIAATALDLAGIEHPDDFDGESVLDWIGQPSKQSPHQEVFWRMPRSKRAFRKGDWKMVQAGGKAKPELFDLSTDLAESNNLAGQHPEKLSQLLADWESMNQAMPPMTKGL